MSSCKNEPSAVKTEKRYLPADTSHYPNARKLRLEIKKQYQSKPYDSAIVLSNVLLDIANKAKDEYYRAVAYSNLGYINKKQEAYKESFESYNQAFLSYSEIDDRKNAGRQLLAMAYIQKNLGDYVNADLIATDALTYLENTGDYKSTAGAYHVIAVSKKENGDFILAKRWNDKSLAFQEDSVASKKINKDFNTFLNTKGNILRESGDYSGAILHYNELLTGSDPLKDSLEIARVKDNLGFTYWLQDSTSSQAIPLMMEALEIRKVKNNRGGLVASNIHLAKYYLNNNSAKAKIYAEQALENAQKVDNAIAKKEAMDLLIASEIKVGINSSEHFYLYKSVTDYIYETSQKNRQFYESSKYENEKLVLLNRQIQLEKDQERAKKIAFQIGVIGAIVIAILLILFLSQRQKQRLKINKIEAAYEAASLMSKRVHDELANDVSGIMSFVDNSVAIPAEIKTSLLDNLEDLYIRARDISTETASINLDSFGDSLKNLLTQHHATGVKIITNSNSGIPWAKIPDYKKVAVYRCIQELMVNMKKHSAATEVTVAFKNAGKQTEIRYTDNGDGANIHQIHLNGLRNVETRMQNIGGAFNFETSEGAGFRAKLTFPH